MKLKSKYAISLLILASFSLFLNLNVTLVDGKGSNKVLLVEVNGEITRATKLMFEDSLKMAKAMDARLAIFVENTPGGEAEAVQEIMTMLENSETPTCVFVYPSGATAWSGGTYILMASHIAAMAPGTTIGSCQPVSSLGPINYSKYINAYKKLMVNHAKLHCRNVTAAERFVTENLNLGADEALRFGVIEVIANNITDLLKTLEKYSLIRFNGTEGAVWKLVPCEEAENYTFIERIDFDKLSDATITKYSAGPQILFLRALYNPLVSSLLLIIGIFAIFIGIKTPGWGAEIAGAICLFLALVSFGAIGIEPAAILFFVLGAALIIAELKTNIGVLAITGAICIIIGALFMFPSPQWLLNPEIARQIQEVLVISAVLAAALFAFVVYKVAETKMLKAKTGAEALIGAEGVAITDLDPNGEVRVLGEYWRAKTAEKTIKKGEKVVVVGKEGLVLIVKASDEKA